MDKVDELIDTLADNILAKIKSGNSRPGEVADNTKALAELITARANNGWKINPFYSKDPHTEY